MKFRAASLVVVLGLLAGSADAAPVLIVSGGILQGATGVVVGSETYDVSFVDGTCAALFSGCDEDTDFTFQTASDAESAAVALLFTVFLDGPEGLFDSRPDLTRGCSDLALCTAVIPNRYVFGDLNAYFVFNFHPPKEPDLFGAGLLPFPPPLNDTAAISTATWALFTPTAPALVPEPATLTLLGLGGVGLACYRRRRRR